MQLNQDDDTQVIFLEYSFEDKTEDLNALNHKKKCEKL